MLNNNYRQSAYCVCIQGGWSPLHCASWNGHHEVVAYLVDRGSDVHAKDDVSASVTLVVYIVL